MLPEEREGINHFAWFFFRLIVKSMALYLHNTGKLGVFFPPPSSPPLGGD